MTDDQDEVLNSTHAAYMPALNRLLVARGTRFANTVVSTSVCCPTRVGVLTGKFAHCHNVTSNWFPSGAWGKFTRLGLDDVWLPKWLQAGGYRTGLIGKFLNGYTVPTNPSMCPKGWDVFDALEANTYNLYNSGFSLNCAPTVFAAGAYQTDTIRDKALAFIGASAASGKPFFLEVTPAAPHRDNGGGTGWRPPPPAARHAGLYPAGLPLPANPTLLKANPLNPQTTVNMSRATTAAEMADLYVGRLRALRAVDEMLEALVSKLSELGILNNTYVIYASDNGMHMGQHSLDEGKATNLEEDVRVPLFVAGPGVAEGAVSAYQANLVDIAPTVLTLAGLPLPTGLDGVVLPLPGLTDGAHRAALASAAVARAGNRTQAAAALTPPPDWQREAVVLEAWESDSSPPNFPGITFKSMRLCSTYRLATDLAANATSNATAAAPALMVPQRPAGNGSGGASGVQQEPLYCLKYGVWCKSNGQELYDLSADPYEANNLLAPGPGAAALSRLVTRLDALLSVLVHCRGSDCLHPYGPLHPNGDVLTFPQAMDPKYDALYASKPRFRFGRCYWHYVTANEVTWTLGMQGFPPYASTLPLNNSWFDPAWPTPRGKNTGVPSDGSGGSSGGGDRHLLMLRGEPAPGAGKSGGGQAAALLPPQFGAAGAAAGALFGLNDEA